MLKGGVLQQVDTSRAMYDHPANVFVAGSIGSPAMNLFPVDLDGDLLHFGGAEVRVPRHAADAAGATGRITVGVRPEDMQLVEPGGGLPTEAEVVEELGSDGYLYGTAEFAGVHPPVIARIDGRNPPSKGALLHLAPRPERLRLFAGDTGERI